MVSQFRALVEALKEHTDLNVIATVRAAIRHDQRLPASVVDYYKPTFEEFAEIGADEIAGNSFLVIIAVASTTARDPFDELAELEEHFLKFRSAVEKAFPQNSISIIDPDIDDMLFGDHEVLGMTFELQLQ
jgi:hypothetical protein